MKCVCVYGCGAFGVSEIQRAHDLKNADYELSHPNPGHIFSPFERIW